MKKAPLILLAIALNTLALFALIAVLDYALSDTELMAIDQESPEGMLHLAFVGDLMCHQQQLDYAQRPNDRFDFTPTLRLIAPIISKADLAFGNLETSLSGNGKPYAGYPTFNTPDAYAVALAQAGFDGMITANNHALDGGMQGAIRTLDLLGSAGMQAIGSYRSQANRKSMRIYDMKGIKFTLLAYTEKSNHPIEEDYRYILNTIDTLQIKEDILQCRMQYAQVIIGISLHFGAENEVLPNAYQEEIVEAVIRAGADFIVGSHPHTLQPIRKYATQNATLDSGVVAFSLGNFLSHQITPPNNIGGILHLYLQQTSQTIKLATIRFTPTLMGVEEGIRVKQHLVIPYDEILPTGILKQQSRQAFDALSAMQRTRLKQGIEQTKAVWGAWVEHKIKAH